ncbi:MAG TPA: universal stress protein [Solirubrobacteraceae bacterium]|nr:universal stress protein [Solirubrobacteraceae bacterium]
MTRQPSAQIGFETVVVGLDGRGDGRDALALAGALLAPGGQLILTTVLRPHGSARLAALFADADRRAAAQMLDAARRGLEGPVSMAVEVRRSVSEGLHAVVERYGADLLVVGSTHRGPLGRVMLGDDTRRALNGARCAVAVAPRGGETPRRLRTIAVGDDGSPESALALSAARALAARSGATIHVCAVVGPASLTYRELSRMDLSEALAQQVETEEVRLSRCDGVETDVMEGEPGESLAELGGEVDLLVIGSRGVGAWGRLATGSTAAYLVRHAPCPVLILPRVLAPSGASAPDAPSPGPRAPAVAAPAPPHPAH